MKLSSLWKSKPTSKVFKTLVVLIPTSILTAIMGFITFYGKNTGNFSINIDDNAYKQNISISNSETDDSNQKILRVKSNPILPIDSNSMTKEALNKIKHQSAGTHNTRNYISYTFYLKNENETLAPSIIYYLIVTQEGDNKTDETFVMNKAVRIMIIEEDRYTIFKSKDSTDEVETKDFNTGQTVIENASGSLGPKEKRKYTFVMWYDIYEASKEDSVKPGQLKFQLNFKVEDETS